MESFMETQKVEEESWSTQTAKFIKGSGKMIKNMVEGLKNFPMEQSILVNINSESLMAMVGTYGKVTNNTKVNGGMENGMEMELGTEPEETFMKDNGVLENLKDLAPRQQSTVTFMKDNSNKL